jgi:hypothetical protein
MPIFLVLDNSLSPILVWTQLPMVEVSVSTVLAHGGGAQQSFAEMEMRRRRRGS